MGRRLPPVIAIDGPSASGKGTVAQEVARALGFHYLDSGVLYRVVALAALEAGLDLEDESRIAHIALNLKASFDVDAVRLDGRNVTDVIRSEALGIAASKVAALPGVRQALLARQRAFRLEPGLVAEGRDMGSVLFPDAVLKIFLTASPEERAKRRYKQLREKGLSGNIPTLSRAIHDRDTRDKARGVAPLQKCAGAVEIDTTAMTIAAAVAKVLAHFEQALRAP